MAGRTQDHAPVGAEPHLDGFGAGFELRPASRHLIFAPVVGIDALQIEVLRIGAGIGLAPGHMAIAARDDCGNSGQRAANDVFVPKGKMSEIPNRGDAESEVRIVGEQRLARDGVRAIHRPIVGRRDVRHAGDLARTHGAVKRVEIGGQRRIGKGREEILHASAAQHGDKLGACRFGEGVARQLHRHALQHRDAVRRRPRFRRRVTGEHELDRPASLMRGEIGVHAIRIGLKHTPSVRRKVLHRFFGGAIKAHCPHHRVGAYGVGPEQFGEPPLYVPARHLHLPQAVLRVGIAERERRIGHGLGGNMGDGVAVAQDLNGGGKPGDAQAAVIAGHGTLERVDEIDCQQHADDRHGRQAYASSFKPAFPRVSCLICRGYTRVLTIPKVHSQEIERATPASIASGGSITKRRRASTALARIGRKRRCKESAFRGYWQLHLKQVAA